MLGGGCRRGAADRFDRISQNVRSSVEQYGFFEAMVAFSRVYFTKFSGNPPCRVGYDIVLGQFRYIYMIVSSGSWDLAS